MIYLDTETVGLTGPVVLVQWARDHEAVGTYEVIGSYTDTWLRLFQQEWSEEAVCGFNLTFDLWQLNRLLQLCVFLGPGVELTPALLATVGSTAQRATGYVWRPHGVLDLMLHARSGPMQSLMERDDVKVRRVPRVLAEELCSALTDRLDLPAIYFARRTAGAVWQVEDEPDDEDFPHVVLRFGARGGLKPLAKHLLGVDTVDFPLPEDLCHDGDIWDVRPLEQQREDAAQLIAANAEFWSTSVLGRRYAAQDVELLRSLRRHWGDPPAGDTNSELTGCVAACRAVGFPIQPQLAYDLLSRNADAMSAAPRSPGAVKAGLHALLTDIEKLAVQDTTGETLAGVVKTFAGHPAGDYAARVIEARSAEKRVDMLGKLLRVGYAAWDFKVVGALSNRMSGGGGINAQGVEKGPIRGVFPMAQGGDFAGFEPGIAAAVYGDDKLAEDLAAGYKIHGLFGAAMYDKSYDEVVATDKKNKDATPIPGLGWDGDLYNPSKHGALAWMYGAQDQKIATTLRLPEDVVAEGVKRFFARYAKLGDGRQRDQAAFCSMTQPGGLGTRVIWKDPAEYVESLFGFRRYFTLENSLTKVLYDLSNDPTPGLKSLERSGIRIRRRQDRVQTPGGAIRSALCGAAFQLQARNMRAAGNHRIQSTGATITKELQLACWQHQPVGVGPLLVQPMNVHDEVDEVIGGIDLTGTAAANVERFRSMVPLLKMSWQRGLHTWEDLK